MHAAVPIASLLDLVSALAELLQHCGQVLVSRPPGLDPGPPRIGSQREENADYDHYAFGNDPGPRQWHFGGHSTAL
jgi:hypothetical protein